jgi:hypothetical protein
VTASSIAMGEAVIRLVIAVNLFTTISNTEINVPPKLRDSPTGLRIPAHGRILARGAPVDVAILCPCSFRANKSPVTTLTSGRTGYRADHPQCEQGCRYCQGCHLR